MSRKKKKESTCDFSSTMAKSRRDADVDMAEEEGVKRIRKPGQDFASGRVHDEEEHAGNLKFEVFYLQDIMKTELHARTHARTHEHIHFVKYFVVT